jgi:glycosyltransferase involved in cell wall biosynthesis
LRILAIIASFNEERFIGGCLEHLRAQGVEAFLCDNESTDATVEIAERYLGAGLRGIERMPRDGSFRWHSILRQKEALAAELDADWFMHLDADEIPLAHTPNQTLGEAFAEVEASGFNAVEFGELTFVPTREAPDHDHQNFRNTMRWYYPFAPRPLHLLRAWKRQRARVDLATAGGHNVVFPGRKIFPQRFRLLHYLFLSEAHAVQKYVRRRYDLDELVRRRWHGWRATLTEDTIHLPTQAELRFARDDDDLDSSAPRAQHCLVWRGS